MKKLVTILLFIAALYGSHEAKAQSSTPVSAGQCMQTDGSGGWSLQSCSSGGSGSTQVVYASTVTGSHPGMAVIAGSSAAGDTDSYAVLQAKLTIGNTKLVLDSGFALSSTLLLSSGDSIECTSKKNGLIMMIGSNSTTVGNLHQNAPTTASGTGGYVPSNITDTNIAVTGCMLNDNSTEAVTGTLSGGAAHTISGSTGLFVTGTFFDGVQGLNFTNNEVYDPGVWSIFISNILNANISNNYIHQPTPMVHEKFTDGIHCIGPCEYVFVNNNNINAGDDSIAINAEDGNRTGLSGPAYVASQWPGVKWGPATDWQVNNNTFNNGFYGLRIISNSELVDRINVSNTSGNLCGNTGTIVAFSPSFGNGNIGKVTIDGWNVQTDGTCNDFSQPYNFILSANIANLQIKGLSILNPVINWPLFTQTAGAIGNLSIRDWDLNTSSSTVSDLFALNGGTIGSISASGLNWNDSIGTGNVFSGSVVPGLLTCSNYAGPNRLLASGFAPTTQNGDCFTNTYSTATTYVNTTFNEHVATTALVGSAPATCANGCTGNWTASANYPTTTPWTYNTNSITGVNDCTSGNFCAAYINAGHANATTRATFTTTPTGSIGGLSLYVRYTDVNNNVLIACNASNEMVIYDIVSGTPNLEATSANTWGCPTGTWTVVANGTSISLTTTAGTLTATISGSNTATNVGLGNLNGAIFTAVASSLSIKSF